MSTSGSIGLLVTADTHIGASYELPLAPIGRTVLRFDQGEGYCVVHASTPNLTADWLEQMASEIRRAASTTYSNFPKAA